MPSWALGSHLGDPPLPPASMFWRAKKGHPKELFSLSLGETEVLENLSNGKDAYSLAGRQFLR